MNLECVGFLALELSKERKNKQKCELILPGVVNRFNKESAEKNSAYAYVFVVKTEAFKHLGTLFLSQKNWYFAIQFVTPLIAFQAFWDIICPITKTH